MLEELDGNRQLNKSTERHVTPYFPSLLYFLTLQLNIVSYGVMCDAVACSARSAFALPVPAILRRKPSSPSHVL